MQCRRCSCAADVLCEVCFLVFFFFFFFSDTATTEIYTFSLHDALPIWGLLFDAIRAHGDPAAAKTPPSGGNLGTTEAILRLLRDAGLADIRAEPTRREWHVSAPRHLLAALSRGTVR